MKGKLKIRRERERVVVGYTDNKNLEEVVKSLKGVENKRMRIEIAYLKEMLDNWEVAEIKWINKNNQIADGLMKKEGIKEGLIKYVEGKEKEEVKRRQWGEKKRQKKEKE